MSILFEADITADIPMFLCEMMKTGLWGEWKRLFSFLNIFEIPKQYDFEIMSEIDSAEVLSCVGLRCSK